MSDLRHIFYLNNKLHIHLRSEHAKSRLTSSMKPDNNAKLDKIIPVRERNDSLKHPHVVTSTAAPSSVPPGYAFRGRRYAQVQLTLESPQNELQWVCLDTGCGMSLIDKTFLQRMCPTAKILRMKDSMKVRGIGDMLYDAASYVHLNFYLPTGTGLTAHFRREIHVVENLHAKILLEMDIAIPEGWIIDLDAQRLTLPHCMSIQVPISAIGKTARTALAVMSEKRHVMPPHSCAVIKITTTKGDVVNLPDHDMIFEPTQQDNLVSFAQLVSGKCEAIIMENSTEQFVVPENQKLGEIIDYNAEAMTVVDENDVYHLTQVPSRISSSWGRILTKGALAAAAKAMVMTASTVKNLSLSAINLAHRRETLLSSGVTVFGNNSQIQALD